MKLKKILLILLIITLVTGCGCSKKDNNKDDDIVKMEEVIENKNEGVIEDKKLDNFTFEKTSLTYDLNKGVNGTSTLITTVTNKGDSNEEISEFIIIAKDKEENVLIELRGVVNDTLKSGESRQIVSYCGIDLSKAYRIEYTKVD